MQWPQAWSLGGRTISTPLASRAAAQVRLVFDYATLRPDATPPDVRFTIYTPAAARTSERFAACLAA